MLVSTTATLIKTVLKVGHDINIKKAIEVCAQIQLHLHRKQHFLHNYNTVTRRYDHISS